MQWILIALRWSAIPCASLAITAFHPEPEDDLFWAPRSWFLSPQRNGSVECPQDRISNGRWGLGCWIFCPQFGIFQYVWWSSPEASTFFSGLIYIHYWHITVLCIIIEFLLLLWLLLLLLYIIRILFIIMIYYYYYYILYNILYTIYYFYLLLLLFITTTIIIMIMIIYYYY